MTQVAATELLPDFSVDRNSPVPLYFQVAQALEKAISSGAIPQGTVLTNEVAFAEGLGLSRPTMRAAMQELVDKGLIARRRGVGTTVVQPTLRRGLQLTSLMEDLVTAGRTPRTQVFSVEVIAAPADVAATMQISTGAPLHRIERLRFDSEQPLSHMINFVPVNLVDLTSEQLETSGLYDLMRRAGIRLHSARQSVGAITATKAQATMLRVPRASALVEIERVTRDDTGRTVELAHHVYPGDRYRYETQLLA